MKSFDEWWGENYMMVSADRTEAEDIYNLGQQSKQTEVDELKRELLNRTNEAYVDGQRSMRKMIKSDEGELRKRIDEVIEYIGTDFDDFYTGVMVESIHEILKGDQS